MKKYKEEFKTLEQLHEIEVKVQKFKRSDYNIGSSKDVFNYIQKVSMECWKEQMFLICLSRSNNVIGWYKISVGGTCGTVVDPKIVGLIAVQSLSQGVILVHNHPSGNLKPSQADIDITRKVKTALSYFDISLLDHLIIAQNFEMNGDSKESNSGYFSFADDGLI